MNYIFRTVALVCIFCLTGCSKHSRPDIPEANADFATRYPSATLIDTEISEDEVIARSFKFSYRLPNQSEIKKIGIQYMEDEDGRYVVRPLPPENLP